MITATKLTGYIGAEISGLDLRQPINKEISKRLRELLTSHHVLVIREQYLSIQQQKALTQIFGELMQLPYVSPLAEDNYVIAVLKEADEHNTGVFGGDWHSDFSFLENPPVGSVLNAVEIPTVGGDTLWVNQAAAYRSLPPSLKEFVEGRQAVHVGKPYGVKYAPPAETRANASIKMSRGDPDADREICHPVVITSPHSGEKALFLNPIYTTRFAGMSEQESQPYLDEIYKHCTRPDFACRLKWSAGDIVVWSNRMTLHYATNDYDGYRRLLYRTAFQ